MKKQIQLLLLSIGSVAGFVIAMPLAVDAAPAPAANSCDNRRLLTLPPWYRGLTDGTAECNIKMPTASGGNGQNGGEIRQFIQILALNIVEILLHIVAYVTIAFIIVGGFKYITSAGSPDGNQKGRTTIVNAVIGLVLSMAAIGIINLFV